MTKVSTTKKPSTARLIARTAADVAIGTTALAADKAIEAVGDVVDKTGDAVDRAGSAFSEGRREARETAHSATRSVRRAIEDTDNRAYEDRTRQELYVLAADRGIRGRSSMRKAELIDALRAER